MTNYEACRKGGLARVKSKCRKCGRFWAVNRDSLAIALGLCENCGLEHRKMLVQVASYLTIPKLSRNKARPVSRGLTYPRTIAPLKDPVILTSKDWKTGDTWDPEADKKTAVRDALQKQEEETVKWARKMNLQSWRNGFAWGTGLSVIFLLIWAIAWSCK